MARVRITMACRFRQWASGGNEPQLDTPFVFVGPEGYPFPADAERRFRERFRQIWNELYGIGN